MLKALESLSESGLQDADSPSLRNHAVARCAAAWDKAYRATSAKSKYRYDAEAAATKAYRQAMPPLTGYDDICDFIACAAYGMLVGAIKEENSSKFLYAAQVALGALEKSKPQTRSAA
ncbi:MAG TPA: hypothetical protein VGG56_17410 [Terracidiphilus sp.]|jgi:hypothetical protein